MCRVTGVDYMKKGTVYCVAARNVTNEPSLHSVKTGSARFIVDGRINFAFFSCFPFRGR